MSTALEGALFRGPLQRVLDASPEDSRAVMLALLGSVVGRPADAMKPGVLLKAVRRLPVELLAANWKLSRAAGKSAGEIALREEGTVRPLHEVLDNWVASDGGAVLSAQALAVDGMPDLIEPQFLGRIIAAEHPQAAWHLVKDFGQIWRRLDSSTFELLRSKALASSWLRRRCLTTLADTGLPMRSRHARGLWGDLLSAESDGQPGTMFLVSFVLWSIWQFQASDLVGEYLPTSRSAEIDEHVDALSQTRAWRRLIAERSFESAMSCLSELTPEQGSVLWGVYALEVDHRISRGELRVERRSEGRYAQFRRAAAIVLSGASDEDLPHCLRTLLGTQEEGLRWGVAIVMADGEVPAARLHEFAKVLPSLIADDHPWVVRESLSGYSSLWPLIDGATRRRLAKIARTQIQRAIGNGWSATELLRALGSASAADPQSFELPAGNLNHSP